MRTNPLRCEEIRRAIRSAKNWLEPIRTATNCKELQRMGLIRIGSTDVLNSLKHAYRHGEPLRTVRFFGELTRSSTEQYDSGESAGDLIRIHIRIGSPSWFATVWLGHKIYAYDTVFGRAEGECLYQRQVPISACIDQKAVPYAFYRTTTHMFNW